MIMTTPTPKQVATIIKTIPQKYGLWYHWTLVEFVEFIITEWEKIRNSPK